MKFKSAVPLLGCDPFATALQKWWVSTHACEAPLVQAADTHACSPTREQRALALIAPLA